MFCVFNRTAAAVRRAVFAVAVVSMAFCVALVGNVTLSTSAAAMVTPFWEEGRSRAGSAVRTKRRYGKRTYGSRKAYKKRGARRTRSAKRYSGKRYRKSSKRSRSYSSYSPSKSLTGGSVRWVASAGCLAGSLKSVVYQVAAKFGPVTVNSTCRSKARNRAVGGAKRSKHLTGQAVDFRVRGNASAVYAYLKRSGSVGGLKHYGGGLFHIDTGPRRSW